MRKRKIKHYLSIGMLLFGISILLFNCQDDETIETIPENNYSIDAQTVSFQEAKSYFEFYQKNDGFIKKSNSDFKVIPNWNTLKNQTIFYTDALLTKASAEVNRNGKFTSELFFIKVKGEMKNAIYTIYKDSVDINGKVINAHIFFNKLNGAFLDGYKIENGLFTKRFIVKIDNGSKKSLTITSQKQMMEDETWPPDCWNTDILDVNGGQIGSVDLGTIAYSSSLNISTNNSYATFNNYYSGATANGGNGESSPGGGGSMDLATAVATIFTKPPHSEYETRCNEGYTFDYELDKCVPILCDLGYERINGICVAECPSGQIRNKSNDCVTPCNTSLASLKSVFPNTNETKLQEIADYINKHGKDFGIDNKEKLQHFLAQAGHESTRWDGVEFGAFEENLNYNVAKLGTDNFQKYFNPITNPTVNPLKANPNDYKKSIDSDYVNVEKFANYVYDDANRTAKEKLGNTNFGDGYKFRGRGIFQLTGKYNYTKFSEFYQKNYDATINFVINPEMISSNSEIAVISALWYFKFEVLNKLIPPLGATTSVYRVTREINSGLKGLDDRKLLFDKAKINIDC